MRDADSILFRRTSLALGTLGVRFRRVCIGGRSHCRKTKASVTMTNHRGEVTEWLKVLASKASVRETVPWVRIPPSPPTQKIRIKQMYLQVCYAMLTHEKSAPEKMLSHTYVKLALMINSRQRASRRALV